MTSTGVQSLTSSIKGLSLGHSRAFLTGRGLEHHLASSIVASRCEGPTIEAAHKKGSGSTKNGRDSIAKRRGVKVFGMQPVKAGGIIMRQLGTKFHPGNNVGLGRDYTIFAKQEGIVLFETRQERRKYISVYDRDHPKIQAKMPKREGPTRRERRYAKYTPRAVQRMQAQKDAAAVENNSKE